MEPGVSLTAIKNVGIKAAESLVEIRETLGGFKSLEHVFENIENEDVILIDDGLIKLQVNEVDDENQTLACTVQEGGLLSRRKGFEVVDKVITKSGLGEEDKEDLRKLAALNVDWVALSFVNQASDVNQAREVLSSIDNQMRVIAKIERLSAL